MNWRWRSSQRLKTRLHSFDPRLPFALFLTGPIVEIGRCAIVRA